MSIEYWILSIILLKRYGSTASQIELSNIDKNMYSVLQYTYPLKLKISNWIILLLRCNKLTNGTVDW